MRVNAPSLDTLVAKSCIHDVQMRYCRGIDRCDAELLRSAYWPDAVDHHGIYDGDADGFIEFVIPHLRKSTRSTHMVCNLYVVMVSDDEAQVETYVLSYSERPSDDGLSEALQGGRYFDRFQKRGEEWRILERTYAMDWNMNAASSAQWGGPIYGRLNIRGERHPEDPSYGRIPDLAQFRASLYSIPIERFAATP